MPRLKYTQRRCITKLFERAPRVHAARALRVLRELATADRISRVRTYSHVALTLAAARLSAPSEVGVAVGGASGAVFPDLPALAGAAWLGSRRHRLNRSALCEEVCTKRSFAGPDAALHSVLPVGASLLILWTLGSKELSLRKPLLTFLIGWAGHVLTDRHAHPRGGCASDPVANLGVALAEPDLLLGSLALRSQLYVGRARNLAAPGSLGHLAPIPSTARLPFPKRLVCPAWRLIRTRSSPGLSQSTASGQGEPRV